MSAKHCAITRRTPTSSKQIRTLLPDRLGGVALAGVRRVEARSRSRPAARRPGLAPRPATRGPDVEVEVADDRAVLLDDQACWRVRSPKPASHVVRVVRAVGEPARHVRLGADGVGRGARRAARRAGASAARWSRASRGRRSLRLTHAILPVHARTGDGDPDEQLGWLVVKTFEELWAELAEKARTRPDGSGTVRAARRRRPRDRQEAGRGGRRVLDGRRARGPGAGGRGDQPAALPRAGADARHRHSTLDDVYAHL